MENLKNFLNNHFWIFIIPLSLLAVGALLVPGFYGASDDLHIAWLYELDQLVKIGQFPPRFVPDLSFGFGYPLFNFVFPLPFYIGEIFHLIGLNFVDSIKTVFLLSIPISGIIMYFFLKRFTTKWLSLAGAVIYMYTPYRSTDMYVRGAIGEIVSFIFLPLLALSVVNLCKENNNSKFNLNLRWVGIGAISLAGLVLTHNITAYMFLPFIFILGIIRLIIFKNILNNLFNLIFALFLGLTVSLYFWLPAILDSSLMKYDTVFNFVDHFPTLQQLVTPYWGYGASVPGPNDGVSFYVGTAGLAIIVFGFLALCFMRKLFSKDQRIILIWAGISFIVAFFMMNNRSIFFWQNLPLIPYFQFPWRFLIITTFMAPIFVIALEKIKIQKVIALIFILLAISTTFTNFHPHDYLGRVDSYYLNRYIAAPSASIEYSKLHEEYLRLPERTSMRPDKNYPRIFSQTDQIMKITEVDSLTTLIKTQSNEKFIINYNKYYFPGWYATIDNQEVEIFPGNPFGQIQLTIPSGQHEVKIGFREPSFKLFLDIVSLTAFIVTMYLIFRLKGFEKDER